jgi:DNA-binding response OmpR family regulator
LPAAAVAHLMRPSRKVHIPPPERTHEIPADEVAPLPRRILLVEDDVGLSQILQTFLESQGFQVESACNGAAAIRRVMAVGFDFIVCDMVMPHFPGEMFYRAVERTKPGLCRRFIFMTGHRGDKKIDQFIRSINGLMLWKPFEFHLLLEAIQTIDTRAQRRPVG